MACDLFGAKSLSEPMLDYCQLGPWEHIAVKFESKYNNLIEEDAFENTISKILVILSRPQCAWPPVLTAKLYTYFHTTFTCYQ